MNEREIIGATAAALIARNHLGADGQTRLLLDRLGDEQVAAICRAVMAHAQLATTCCLRIPREVGRRAGLPEAILTDDRTTYWRNQHVEGYRVMLLANADDEQGQSLGDLTLIGSGQLLSEPGLWVTSAGLDLSDRETSCWTAALQGLIQSRSVSLDRLAGYVVATRSGVKDMGLPVESALGHALPALQAPRDRTIFAGLAAISRGQTAKWKSAFQLVFRKRGPYLNKKHPTEQPISSSELWDNFEKVRDQIDGAHHALFEAFIEAPPGWGDAVRALAGLEWENDNVKALFENLKKKKLKIGAATRDHFEAKLPTDLTDDESAYLNRLDGRSARESEAEDEEFYERHRFHLGIDPRLKASWDRFVYGKAIETDDFRAGLLRAIERLFDQLVDKGGRKTLTIECHRHTAKQWEEVNEKAARYFALRYQGLRSLFGRDVQWVPENLFEVADADTVSVSPKGKKAKASGRNSVAKAANQVKFTVKLGVLGQEDETVSAQVVWCFEPKSIFTAFAKDWQGIRDNPFAASAVTREVVSAKGRLQAVDLRDVQTLMPVGHQSRGSLLARRDREPLDLRFARGLKDAARHDWITPLGHEAISRGWQEFAAAYAQAINEFLLHGTASNSELGLGDSYARLMNALVEHAPSDKGRRALWQPVLELGVAFIEGGDSAAIVAPWHPLRIVASAAKDRRFGGLVRYLLREETVEFGDSRLFFRDLAAEIAHPFYPEVCLGQQGDQPVLLACTDTCGDYSLMEPATRDASAADAREHDGTNEDPREAAKVIRYVVGQFLALYPHEAANLSVVLYNCDTVGLPEATVALLGEMNGGDDDRPVRCHVQLRHTEPQRLQSLYETLLESSVRDTDSVVASEATRDFMARLRVGIMASQTPTSSLLDGMPADIVFLQDVVARLCTLDWVEQPNSMTATELTTYVPSQRSRRRPAMRDDLHSTTDLCCPVQTPAGWSYLRGVCGLVNGRAPGGATLPLPTRRVRFDHGLAKKILDDAHRLGQWVVNFDEILTRQHLRNLGVRIVRYRQAADGERGVVVSSRAPLTMLHTLVQRNLRSLGLPLPEGEISTLAERLVDYASEVSGDIVLRAARRSTFAHELIGVALSRYLLEDELGEGDVARGWYFLDDYAEWLGQREGFIADILALSPRRDASGRVTLTALVSEAKYVSAEIVLEQRSHSGGQAQQTLARMENALFNTPRRLDRDHWLARFADLLAESVVASQTSRHDLQSWQRDIAEGRMEIQLRGYSHVFVYAKPPDVEVDSTRSLLPHVASGWQETYSPDAVRKLIVAFHRGDSPRSLRKELGSEAPWAHGVARRPAEGANWAASITKLDLLPPPTKPVPEPTKPKLPRAKARPAAQPAKADTPTDNAERPPSSNVDPTGFEWAPHAIAVLLNDSSAIEEQRAEDLAWLEKTGAELASALRQYKLQARLVDKRLTPNVALLRFQGSDQLTVKDVEKYSSQLLTTYGLRVIRVSAEPGAVVVSIARLRRELVSLPAVLRGREVDDAVGRVNQRLVVGVRESDGTVLYLRPGSADAPHTLIAGTTGSGKSVLLQNLIIDIALTNSTSAATITLIDPKQGVDYQILEGLPHLGGEIVVEQDKAIQKLEALAEEMDDRYRLFRASGAGVRDLADYNRRVGVDQRLPVRWLVHDEFAEWMLVDEYKSAVQNVVQRLGVKARAAGIRLIFAAQRPEDRVMPVQLRDNLGNRLILRVESEGTSKIALLEEGAEKLLGKGQLAARLQSEDGIVLAQVPMLAPDVMEALVAAVRAGDPPS